MIGLSQAIPEPGRKEFSSFLRTLTLSSHGQGTVFQRMNEKGELLRIASSPGAAEGWPGVGSFIPETLPDGRVHPVVQAMREGRTHTTHEQLGREWYVFHYTPLSTQAGRPFGALLTAIPDSEAREKLIASLQRLTIAKTGYPYVLNAQGADKGRYVVSYQGKRNGELILDAKDASGRAFIKEIVEKAVALADNEKGTAHYPWKNKEDIEARWKTARYVYFTPWDWVIAVGSYDEEFYEHVTLIEQQHHVMLGSILSVALVGLMIAGGAIYRYANQLIVPMHQTLATVGAVAEGDLSTSLEIQRTDELGQFADGVEAMRRHLRELINAIGENAIEVENSSDQLSAGSHRFASGADALNAQARVVADAGSMLSSTLQAVTEDASQLTQATESVASAIQELDASAVEVARQCEQESKLADQASAQADSARSLVTQLSRASQEVGTIVQLISSIADQTNLLALNASIEAANAGAAGRGFGIVANEVKELARQTTAATKQIDGQIRNVQDTTQKSAREIERVGSTIHDVNQIARAIAAAAEKQSSTIQLLSQSMGQTAQVAARISVKLEAGAQGARSVSQSIQAVSQVAREVSEGAAQNSSTADGLTRISHHLREVTSRFKL